jgi:hypothetical protein
MTNRASVGRTHSVFSQGGRPYGRDLTICTEITAA